MTPRRFRRAALILAAATLSVVASGGSWATARLRAHAVRQTNRAASEPWTRAQTVAPEDLAKEIQTSPATARPVVACVGFQALYHGGHVPGAVFHGPASDAEGLADLKRWAQTLSPSTNVVLYCGCCPFAACPNVRPAFSALREMGFSHIRVLVLPHNFGSDWAGQGLPVDR